MPKSSFVDFKAVKAAISMEQVLQHYGLLDQFKRSRDSLSGACPIHKGANPTQFRVSLSKNLWNCFGECKHGGNALDFIVRMEDISVHAAALKAIEWFGLDPAVMRTNAEAEAATPKETATSEAGSEQNVVHKPDAKEPEKDAPNKPLNFRLEKLDSTHPYLGERGLSQETIIDFGLGYCGKGVMAERIAIPIHNPDGKVVAYAGRWPGTPAGEKPKYKLPQGFRKSLELFNIDRALKEAPDAPLVIVEGFFDCMKLHQCGHRKVVALMGSTMSPAQEELVRKYSTGKSRILLLLDEDDAGRAGREDMAVRLVRIAFVKVHTFPKEGMQPDQLTATEVQTILGGVS